MRAKSLLLVALLVAASPAMALITGGDDDRPLDVLGWPAGAAEAFNVPERIAYWEGPPFGGGQYHGEFRGDTAALNDVLKNFEAIENDNKRIVVQDGIGYSSWLRVRPSASKIPTMDWQLMVWSKPNWKQLSGMQPSLNPTDPADREIGPPTELTIYTGGNIKWAEVKLPEGVEVIDNRLESHGFTAGDGFVVEGNLVDVETGEAIDGQMELRPRNAKADEHGKTADPIAVLADSNGRWLFKNVPKGSYNLVATQTGYVSRAVGYVHHDGQLRWQRFEGKLARCGAIAGRVTDTAGEPLADVSVRLRDTSPAAGGRYDLPDRLETTTDANGEFHIESAPVGTASISIYKPGYCRPGLAPSITVPSESVDLQMVESSNITVIVLFETTEVPDQYMVEITPEGGNKVGSWGGSATIDENNQYIFKDVPPGKYTLVGHPNPHSENEKTEPITLDLKGGEMVVKTITVGE